MNKFYSIAVMVISIMTACLFTFISCSDNDDYDFQLLMEQQKTVLNKETSDFKSNLVSALTSQNTRAVDGEFVFSEEQLKNLKELSLKMFESHGYAKEYIENVVENNDERLIMAAAIFTAIVESPSTPIVKTRVEGNDNEECYNANSVSDCLLRAAGIKELLQGCIKKATILKLISKYVPGIGYAAAVVDFANCMGWVEWW